MPAVDPDVFSPAVFDSDVFETGAATADSVGGIGTKSDSRSVLRLENILNATNKL